MGTKTVRHKCFEELDVRLKQYNTCLVRNILNENHIFIDTELREKKRGARPRRVVANYCPFCGKKLKNV